MMKNIKVFLLMSCFFVSCHPDIFVDDDVPYEKKETKTVTDSTINVLEINDINGSIIIQPGEDKIIEAEINKISYGESIDDARAHIGDIKVIESQYDNKYLFTVEFPDNSRKYVCDFTVLSASNIFQKLTTLNGSIAINRMEGGANVKITNGSLATVHTKGIITANITNGSCIVQNHQGSIYLISQNGSFEGELDNLSAGDTVDIKLKNGNAVLNISGNIEVYFVMNTVNGNININGFDNIDYIINSSHAVAGKIGNGVVYIKMETTNGNLILQRNP